MSIYDGLVRCDSHRVSHAKCDVCEIVRLRAELARYRSCVCTRIPSRDWHLERCPAKETK